MNEGRILTLLERIGCKQIRKRGDEVSCRCPFSEHHKHGDRRPSFGVRINDEGSSPYNCFACGEKGVIEGLAFLYGHTDLVDGGAVRSSRKGWYYREPRDRFDLPRYEDRPVRFKDDYLEPFVGVLPGYLLDRGISIDTARKWELGKDKRYSRATFTVREYTGHLAMIIGRDITGKSLAKYSNYILDRVRKRMLPFLPRQRGENDFVRPTKKFFLYGEHIHYPRRNDESYQSSDLIVVEGPMDVLRLDQYGYNAVGLLGSSPSAYQINKLVELAPRAGRVIAMADGDDAGRRLTKALEKQLKYRVSLYDAQLSDGMDPDGLSAEEIEFLLQGAIRTKSS